MSSRAWERGRLARIAGKPKASNPHRVGGKCWREWLAGWIFSADRIEAK